LKEFGWRLCKEFLLAKNFLPVFIEIFRLHCKISARF